MRTTTVAAPRLRGALLALAFLAALVTAVLWQFAASGAGAQADGTLVAQPSFGAPATTFLGATPLEAPGEVWAVSTSGATLARYTDAGGWETLPAPLGADGQPISGLAFVSAAAAGRTTPRGGLVTAATGEEAPLLIVRDPGGTPRAAPEPPSAVLEPGESLFAVEGADGPLLAALEAGGGTRALVVPATAGEAPRAVLSFAAGNWSQESICVGFAPGPACTAPPSTFRVVAIEAGGGRPGCWPQGRRRARASSCSGGRRAGERRPGASSRSGPRARSARASPRRRSRAPRSPPATPGSR